MPEPARPAGTRTQWVMPWLGQDVVDRSARPSGFAAGAAAHQVVDLVVAEVVAGPVLEPVAERPVVAGDLVGRPAQSIGVMDVGTEVDHRR